MGGNLQDLNSTHTDINTEEVLVQIGLYILGNIVGELFHRISILLDVIRRMFPVVVVWSGLYILGIIVGELLYRISLLIDEYQHIIPKHKRNMKKAKESFGLIAMWLVPFKKAGKAVFSNKQSQYVKAPLIVCLAVLLLYLGDPGTISLLDVIQRMCPVVLVWSGLRMFGAFDNSLEDMEILEESNAELGPGLGRSSLKRNY